MFLIDPYKYLAKPVPWANVKLLMHFDGGDGSQVYVDSSASNHHITQNGTGVNCEQSSADFVFGPSSHKNWGAGNYLTIDDTQGDFNVSSKDFTLQLRAKSAEWWDQRNLVSKQKGGAPPAGTLNSWFCLSQDASGRANVKGWDTSGNVVINLTTTSYPFNSGPWAAIAVVKKGTTWYLFANGKLEASGTQTAPIADNTNQLVICRDNVNVVINGTVTDWYGYVDELRFVVGQALFTADYTVETSPFPNS